MNQSDEFDLPTKVTVIEGGNGKRPTSEIIKDMGFEVDETTGEIIETERFDDKPAEKPAVEESHSNGNNGNGLPVKISSSMSLETAATVIDSDGVKYIDLDSKTLTGKLNSMLKKIGAGEYKGDELIDKKFKCDAALIIIRSRKQGKKS